jgi:hypothetical protein
MGGILDDQLQQTLWSCRYLAPEKHMRNRDCQGSRQSDPIAIKNEFGGATRVLFDLPTAQMHSHHS